MTYQITTKFHEKLKFEIKFSKKLIFESKKLKVFEIFKILFFEHGHCVTHQITVKFHEKLKFDFLKNIFFKKIIFGSKKLRKLLKF